MIGKGQRNLSPLWLGFGALLSFWIVFAYGHTATAFLADQLFVVRHEGNLYASDFLVFYNSGSIAWGALEAGVDIYDPAVQQAGLTAIAPQLEESRVFFSQYPPYVFLLFMPLALLSLETAWLLWASAGLAGIALGTRALLSEFVPEKRGRAFIYLAVLSSLPAWLALRIGQMTPLALPALVWFWFALSRKSWFQAGLAAGLFLLKLQYAPAVVLVGAALGRGRFLAGFALVAGLLVFSSGALLGWEHWLHYPGILHFAETSPEVVGVSVTAQQNLRGQLALLRAGSVESRIAQNLVTAIWLIASAGLAVAWWYMKRRGQLFTPVGKAAHDSGEEAAVPSFFILAAVTVLVLLVTSPHTHSQDYLLATLPCVWLCTSRTRSFTALQVLIVGFPVFSWMFFVAIRGGTLIVQPFFAWGVLVLATLCLHGIRSGSARWADGGSSVGGIGGDAT